MKRVFSLVLALLLALSALSLTAFAEIEYTGFDVVFKETEGTKVNDTDICIFAAIGDDALVDRTGEFTMEGVRWYQCLPEPEAGKTADDYDYVDKALQIYGVLCNDDDVFDHAHYFYVLVIDRLYAQEEDTFHRNVMINGVGVDEMNGTCYNTGNEFFIKTVTNGGAGYDASEWAQTWMEEADGLGLIPDCLVGVDLKKQITRQEFAAVAVKIYESLAGEPAQPVADNPFIDCDDPEVLKALNVGITVGTAADKFSPDDTLTREQCATMLTRVYKKVAIPGWSMSSDASFDSQFKAMFTMPALFDDDAQISGYAKDSVYFMAANGIINGVGNNLFAPKHGTNADEAATYGLATREQALKIAVGMVQNLK